MIVPRRFIRACAVSLSLFLVAFARTAVADTTPDARGAFAIGTWDAGMQMLDTASIHVHVYFPMGKTDASPVVAVVHGAARTAANMAEMSNTLASRGFVVLAPDMPCALTCDHAANARQIRALLAWGVAQSADASSMLAGKIDGGRRGVIGHSWGGLGSFLAAEGDASIGSVVMLDANDDHGVGAAAAPMVHQPSIHIMAQVMGSCNATNWKQTVYPLTPAPHMRVVVSRAAHCDAEDPSDSLCPLACSSGDPSLSYLFRRYAVAWTACLLQSDASMASWLGGSDFNADVSASKLTLTDFSGLAALPCMSGASTDAGVPDSGSPPPPPPPPSPDAGGAGAPEPDAGLSDSGGATSRSSAGCSVARGAAGAGVLTLLTFAALVLLGRRRLVG